MLVSDSPGHVHTYAMDAIDEETVYVKESGHLMNYSSRLLIESPNEKMTRMNHHSVCGGITITHSLNSAASDFFFVV